MRRLSASIVGCGTLFCVTHSMPVGMCDTQWVAGRTYCQSDIEPTTTSSIVLPSPVADGLMIGMPVSGFWIEP